MRKLNMFMVLVVALGVLAGVSGRQAAHAQTNTDPLRTQTGYGAGTYLKAYRVVSSSDTAVYDDATIPGISLTDGKALLRVGLRFAQSYGNCQLVCVRGQTVGGVWTPLTVETLAVVTSGGTSFGLYCPENDPVFDASGGDTARLRVLSLSGGPVTLHVTRQ